MDQKTVTADRTKVAELLALIQTNTLSLSEAATSLAGFRLKTMQAAFPARTAYDHDALYRSALVELESQLPGWQGLSVDRHFAPE